MASIAISYNIPVREVSGSGPGYQSGYRSGDLGSYDNPVWDVSVLVPGYQSGYRSGDQ